MAYTIASNMTDLDRAKTAWRGNLRDIEDHLYWIANHRRTIERGTERPAFIQQCRRQMKDRLRQYRAAVRNATEAEQTLRAAGVAFQQEL